jgi:hypothetical protein
MDIGSTDVMDIGSTDVMDIGSTDVMDIGSTDVMDIGPTLLCNGHWFDTVPWAHLGIACLPRFVVQV